MITMTKTVCTYSIHNIKSVLIANIIVILLTHPYQIHKIYFNIFHEYPKIMRKCDKKLT